MFDNFPRMFSSDDTSGEEEAEDGASLNDLGDLEDPDGPEPEAGESDDTDTGPNTEDLNVRLSEVEEDIDATESSLRSLRSSQEEMAASVDEMNDTIRRLAGMYDQIAAQQNPFVDDEEPDDVVGEPAGDGGEEVVSFEDLQEEPDDGGSEHGQHEDAPGAMEHEDGPETTAHEHDGTPEQTGSQNGDGSHEQGSTEPDHHETSAVDSTSAPVGMETDASERPTPLLSSVPEGYAGDVLVMEWLAMLMNESGPAGALRAVEYYDDVGWISSEVRDHLVNVIGGPALDVFVDPTRPREPTADEHVESQNYLRVIGHLREL